MMLLVSTASPDHLVNKAVQQSSGTSLEAVVLAPRRQETEEGLRGMSC